MQRCIRCFVCSAIIGCLLKAFSSMLNIWFTHRTFDLGFSSGSCTPQQFFDDFVMVGIWWSKGNHLQLHVSKIKGLVVDFWQSEKLLTPLIQGKEVEMGQTLRVRMHINKSDLTKRVSERRQRRLLGSSCSVQQLSPGNCGLCLQI